MIQNHDQWFAAPQRGRPAEIAFVEKDLFSQEPGLEMGRGLIGGVLYQDFVEGTPRGPGMPFAFEMALTGKMGRIQPQAAEMVVHRFVVAPGRGKP
jgi:hypothetical protein